jgi:hypothetical protein
MPAAARIVPHRAGPSSNGPKAILLFPAAPKILPLGNLPRDGKIRGLPAIFAVPEPNSRDIYFSGGPRATVDNLISYFYTIFGR